MLLWLAFLLTYLQGRLINIDKTNCLNDNNFLLLVIQFLIIFSSLCSVIWDANFINLKYLPQYIPFCLLELVNATEIISAQKFTKTASISHRQGHSPSISLLFEFYNCKTHICTHRYVYLHCSLRKGGLWWQPCVPICTGKIGR